MQIHGQIHHFPRQVKLFILSFLIVLNIGFTTGLFFVGNTQSITPNGMVENYLGNEEDEEALEMKFKKSEHEMLTLLHTHVLSTSFIFFLLGCLLAFTSLPKKLKYFLMIEPFLSIVLTFGGLYLLWNGILWIKYIVMISGIVMTGVFYLGSLMLIIQLFKKQV
jgi:hypothetical protein